MTAPADRWRHTRRGVVLTAAAIAAVVCLVGWPHPTLVALGAVAGAIAVVAGIRGLIRGPKTITAPTDQQVTAQTEPAADQLTAEEARTLADDLGLQLYRAEDALAYVGECCDIADRHGKPVTTARVREWLKGAQCARVAGLVLDPDASGAGPETARTDPDDLRTRLADAIRDAAHNCDSKCGLTEDRCAAAHPIQIEYWTDDVVSGVAGPVDALTAAVLTAIRPERCCSCGSNDVVYHNFHEQPFCSPCADGDRPAMHRAAEQQIRAAAGRLLYPVGARVLDALDEPNALTPPADQPADHRDGGVR